MACTSVTPLLLIGGDVEIIERWPASLCKTMPSTFSEASQMPGGTRPGEAEQDPCQATLALAHVCLYMDPHTCGNTTFTYSIHIHNKHR